MTWLLATSLLLSGSAAAVPGDGFDALAYRVSLTPDFSEKTIAGVQEIDLRISRDGLRELAFTPNKLVIAGARVDGRPLRAVQREDALVLVPYQPLRQGQRVRITLPYAGREPRGLHFTGRSVFSSWFSCDWMVCVLDRPGDKATIEMRLSMPAGLKTLAPGRLVSRRKARADKEIHIWRSERPYSAYLYAFAAGPYAEAQARAQGVTLKYLSENASPERLQALFAPTKDMLAFFQDKAGMPLPVRTYSQLHTPGAEAQEAATFSLIGEKLVAPHLETPQEDWVIAHELAHQFWGNSITCADWSQFWLNEGLATFMVAAWKEYRWGRATYDREMQLAERRRSAAAGAGFDVKLTFAGAYPNLATKRAITYSKGALFLDALRRDVGDAAFWKGLRLYTRRHRGGVVTSRDFQRAYEQASGRELSGLFNAWVY